MLSGKFQVFQNEYAHVITLISVRVAIQSFCFQLHFINSYFGCGLQIGVIEGILKRIYSLQGTLQNVVWREIHSKASAHSFKWRA